MIPIGRTDVSAVRPSLLAALAREGRASLFFLRSETGFSEKDLLACALTLEQEGLVAVEGRPDGNTSRRMVGLTARARRGADAGRAPASPYGDQTAEGGAR
ncbi:MAG: hypothetical protein M3R38_32735 [Actinomycetota bacterium]|nr:hypothetical protein [Actinomycetota bacterium]